MGLRLALAVAVACLALPQATAARPLLGVTGNPDRFEKLTGQRSTVVQKIVGWGQGDTWGSSFESLFATMGDVPLLSITMDAKDPPGRTSGSSSWSTTAASRDRSSTSRCARAVAPPTGR